MTDLAPFGLTVALSNLIPALAADVDELVDIAVAVEEWGAGAVMIGEHVVWTESMQHPSGRPVTRSFIDSMPDPFVLLSAVASRTTSLQLLTGTLVGSLRHPLLLARMAASLSRLSRGRLHLGVAAGWCREEFAALDVPFDERFARMDEMLAVCRSMWSADGGLSFTGRFTSFADVLMTPAPYDGGVPFWIGGAPTDITARRVAKHGYGWITSIQASPQDIERGVEVIVAGCERRGRAADSIAVLAQLGLEPVARPTLDDSLVARIEHLQGLSEDLLRRGATHVSLPLGQFARDRAEAETMVRALVGASVGPA